ncbi:MAG: hypothetical protein U5K99_00230 [Anaerolineales bacterium]|nr:hypothetical protein [Anaerolineales bacterium]
MEIKPRYYPSIILTTLILFTALGLILGFRPGHRGQELNTRPPAVIQMF